MWAVLLGCLVGLLALVRFQQRHQTLLFYVGMGFSGAGLLMGIHSLVEAAAFPWLAGREGERISDWSWVASLLFLSCTLLVGARRTDGTSWKPLHPGKVNSLRSTGIGIVVILAGLLLALPLPSPYSGWLLERPVDLLLGVLLAVTAIHYFRHSEWRTERFPFAVTLSLACLAAMELGIVPFSSAHADAGSDAALLVEVLAFLITAAGLAVNTATELRNAEVYTKLLNTMTDATSDAIVAADADGTIVAWNRASVALFGYSEDEILGKSLFLLIPERHRPPEGVPLDLGVAVRGMKESGRALERRALLKDGTELPVELSLASWKRHDGQESFVAIVRDITSRKEVEQQQRRLSHAVEAVEESIVITDVDGTIQYVNPAFTRVTGYTAGEAIGKNPRILKSGHQRPSFYREMWETIQSGRTWCGRFQNVKKDGTLYTETASIAPVTDHRGRVINFVAVKKDISEELERADREQQTRKLQAIGQLAAGIAHEINTPTQYVSDNTVFLKRAFDGFVRILEQDQILLEAVAEGVQDDDLLAATRRVRKKAKLDFLVREVPKALDQSLEGLGRVANIVSAMKEFSHPSEGTKEPVDLAHALETTITVARNEWKYVADVETDFAADLPPVPCLRDEFNQAVLNMIVNAAHAIGETIDEGDGSKGTIRITTREENRWAEVRISDTGAGIAESNLKKIFDPFFTTKAVGKGTGQGLAIAHDVVVKKHGGELSVESEPGKGTTFLIRLPLDDSDGKGKRPDEVRAA